MENPDLIKATYNDNRKCLFDGKPIADHIHAHTKFCERQVLPDGSIKSCKDDYHAEKNRLSNLPYQELVNFHKRITASIALMVKQKGYQVTGEDLDQFGIYTNRAVKLEMAANQQCTFWFIDFAVTQIDEKHLKITNHDNKF